MTYNYNVIILECIRVIFEWNESKSQRNLRKHGVSFNEAVTVFLDELGRLMPDPDHSEGEERFILMGTSSKSNLLLVCYCEREPDVVRLISARKASRFERKQYEEYSHA